jgi:hypothetical protein
MLHAYTTPDWATMLSELVGSTEQSLLETQLHAEDLAEKVHSRQGRDDLVLSLGLGSER